MHFSVKKFNTNETLTKHCFELKEKMFFGQKNHVLELYDFHCIDLNEIDVHLLKYVSRLLCENGFSVVEDNFTEKNVTVELHYGSSFGEKMTSILDVHQEKDGDFEKGGTLIFYLENTAENGELNIYQNSGNLFCKIPTKLMGENEHVCIMFDHETWHSPETITNGQRIALSFHFKSKDII